MNTVKSTKGKDPAFLFYSSDFLTGTILMSDEQVGKYVRLMCIQHQKGRLSEKDMLNICKTYDEEVFQKFTKDEHGLYYNVRLDIEIQKRKAYTESRRQNRLSKNTSETYVSHMENENENEIKEEKKTIINIPFLDFWEKYDNKKGKAKSEKKWNSLTNKVRQLAYDYIDTYKALNRDPKFWKHPHTYLCEKCWEDETPVVKMGKVDKALSIDEEGMITYESNMKLRVWSWEDFKDVKAGKKSISIFDRKVS